MPLLRESLHAAVVVVAAAAVVAAAVVSRGRIVVAYCLPSNSS